jgi:hypothetical protein
VHVESLAGGGVDPFGIDIAFLLEQVGTLERREGLRGHFGLFWMLYWEE